jgi:hypothetical protein
MPVLREFEELVDWVAVVGRTPWSASIWTKLQLVSIEEKPAA